MRPLILIALYLVLPIATLLGWTQPCRAEATAQSTHWGALAFPDHDRILTLGFTTDRFTEFDGAGKRYNDMRQTDGLNFWSLSWTERWSDSKAGTPISRSALVPQGTGLAGISKTTSCINSGGSPPCRSAPHAMRRTS